MIDLPRHFRARNIRARGVIHVGAHEGEELAQYRDLGFERVLLVEANPAVFQRLQRNAEAFPGVRLANVAISNHAGRVMLNIASFDQSSSLLSLKEHSRLYSSITVTGQVPVRAVTLDGLLDELQLDPADYNYLHLDIQGAELMALQGAQRTLRSIEVIGTEVSFEELYEGCARFEDLDGFLTERGFRQVDLACPFHPSWGDALYLARAVAERPEAPGAVLTPVQEAEMRKAAQLQVTRELGQAEAIYERLMGAAPSDFRLNHLLGALRHQQGRTREALLLLDRALRLRPDSAPTLACKAMALATSGSHKEAETALRRALELDPTADEAWLNLASIQVIEGKIEAAIASIARALDLKPVSAAAWTALGSAFHLAGRAVESVIAHTRALELDPEEPHAHFGRGQALQACHCVEEAVADFDAKLRQTPDDLHAMSSRLFLRNFQDRISREDLAAEHVAYGRAVEGSLRKHARAPLGRRRGGSDGRIRVIFLSPDLRTHPIPSFFEPLLRHLDRSQFEVGVYHDHPIVDAVTERMRALADFWRHTVSLGPEAFEAKVREDAPEVLIDLAGHTGFNRIEVFARRLAPVQVTYLGYPNTTGLAAMDYRFTDGVADPVGDTDHLHTERLVRFASTAWAFQPLEGVEPRPRSGGPIVFGSFNTMSKVSGATLELWRRVLDSVPGARLVLKSVGMIPERWSKRIAAAGIDPARVELRLPLGDLRGHLASYGDIDVALDAFPYNGTTTTCEALWMGVPVVTLAGDRHGSRVGASLLTAIGQTEWIASAPEAYVGIARRLSDDRAGRVRWRSELREMVRRSPLLDHEGQARRFGEALLRCCGERGIELRGKNLPKRQNAEPACETVVAAR